MEKTTGTITEMSTRETKMGIATDVTVNGIKISYFRVDGLKVGLTIEAIYEITKSGFNNGKDFKILPGVQTINITPTPTTVQTKLNTGALITGMEAGHALNCVFNSGHAGAMSDDEIIKEACRVISLHRQLVTMSI